MTHGTTPRSGNISFGCYYLNFKSKAQASKTPQASDHIWRCPRLEQDRYGNDLMPLDLYSGGSGRVGGIMFGTEFLGKNFISTRLYHILMALVGVRLGHGKPEAQKQFGALASSAANGLRDGVI